MKNCLLIDLPITDYSTTLDLQYRILNAKISGRLEEDVLILVEHPPVFTLGKRGGMENMMIDPSYLIQVGIDIIHTERGGNITYHGPGQIVGYPIINLKKSGLSVVDYVSKLEDVMIQTAANWNISASRSHTNRGVWVGNNKLGSVGITIRRQISFHGFALNVNVDLKPFEWIHPCGLKNIGMTSFEKELSKPMDMQHVRMGIQKNFQSVFGIELITDVKPSILDQLTF